MAFPKAGSEATTPEATVDPLPIAATTSPWSIVSVKEVEVPAVVWAYVPAVPQVAAAVADAGAVSLPIAVAVTPVELME